MGQITGMNAGGVAYDFQTAADAGGYGVDWDPMPRALRFSVAGDVVLVSPSGNVLPARTFVAGELWPAYTKRIVALGSTIPTNAVDLLY